MRYTALTAILLAATAVVATPDYYNYDSYDAATTCTDDAPAPTITAYHQEYVTVTAAPVIKTKTIRRKKTRYGIKTKTYTYAPEPTYVPVPVYTPEPSVYVPEPTYAPEPSATGSPVEAGSYSDQCLQAHNVRRAAHGVPALVWDEELAAWAQNVSGSCSFQHSSGPYGENLASGGDGSPEEYVNRWYVEGKDKNYSYGSGGFSSETGHFTQVIWKGTTRLGCATVECPGYGFISTCEYADAGNVQGLFQENVLPGSYKTGLE